ncbi:MAG: DUF2142 domain-containing protein [Acidimicrobiales bacterium]
MQLPVRRLVSATRSNPRWRWTATFLLVAIVGTVWAFSDPLFAPADEASHTIRAAAVSRGQLTGDPLTPEQAADLTWGIGGRQGPPPSAYLAVDVPGIYDTPAYNCFVFQPAVTPDCVHFSGSTATKSIVTAVPRYPPAYYAWVGILSRPFEPGSVQMYAMRIASVLLMAALLASAFETVFTFARSRVAALGLLVAVTPQVLFINAAVNPSAMEIAAGIALWTSGVTLARATPEQISNRLIARTGSAAILLVLARHASPLWLGLILVALVLFTNRETLKALVRRRAAWLWGIGVAIAAVSTVAWIAVEDPLSTQHSIFPAGGYTNQQVLRFAFGGIWGHYRAMIGLFGWSDTPVPSLTIFLWTGLVGILAVVALAFCRGRRPLLVFAGICAGSALVPVAVDSYSAISNDVGMTWQGRYGLPFAVGVPIVAGLLASTTESQVFFKRRVLVVLWATVVVAQTAAFWQMLRKYTSGADGALRFWVHPKWTPPIPVVTVAIAFPLAMAAFGWWCLSTARWTEESGFSEAASQLPRLAHSAP